MLYNIVLVSTIHQHESAIGIHMSLPFRTCLPPPAPSHPSRLSQSPVFDLPEIDSKSPLVVCFAYDNVCVSMLLFRFILF